MKRSNIKTAAFWGGSPAGKARSRGVKLAGLAISSIALAGCSPAFGAYRGVTTQGRSTFHLFQGFAITAIFVGGITFGLLFFVLLRYRKRSDAIPTQRHSNVKIEILYTVIPILIVVGLFFFTVKVENKVDAISPTPNVKVTVTAFQWGWKFYYPATNTTVIGSGNHYPQLVLPEGETTAVTLVSQDVVHGFYIPAFNFSRYALPGFVNHFDFTPTSAGTYIGRCSQLCGLYHSEMLFSVKVLSAQQFQSWTSSQAGKVTA